MCDSRCLLGGGDPGGGWGVVQGNSRFIGARDALGPVGGNLSRDKWLIKHTGLAGVYAPSRGVCCCAPSQVHLGAIRELLMTHSRLFRSSQKPLAQFWAVGGFVTVPRLYGFVAAWWPPRPRPALSAKLCLFSPPTTLGDNITHR